MLSAALWVSFQVSASGGPRISVAAERIGRTPILAPSLPWNSTGLFNPTAVEADGGTVLLFRATDAKMTSRIGFAKSADGIHFHVGKNPVLTPEAIYEKGGGVEDPRVVLIAGTYYLTYTGYNGKDAQLCMATSKDLIHWTRNGVILPAYKGTWNTKWTKSGAIVPRKIGGKWWMYYLGTRTDPDGKDRDYMGLANSTDLEHWVDATDAPVLPRRPNAFDSRVMEPGPTPILTTAGILVLYNGASEDLVYGPAWALFDGGDPTKLIERAEKQFLLPKLDWEKKGVVPNVIFLEGAVFTPEHDGTIEGRGYYGAADTSVGAAHIHIQIHIATAK